MRRFIRSSESKFAPAGFERVRDPALIFLGPEAGGACLARMPLAEVVARAFSIDLSAYPRWAVILAGAAVAAVALWLLMKVLKWTLWLLIGAVLLGGLAWAAWELLR